MDDRKLFVYRCLQSGEGAAPALSTDLRGGATKSGDIRDLKGVVEREGAAMGIFLTLNRPTREMEKEAVSAGFYETGNHKFPRLQILTAEEVIEGRRPQVPFSFTESLKKASRESGEKQGTLL